ncbi:MAG: septum formation protein Maf [Myxococcales bacterium]|nr:septum formation protein Maf [Myxococcales bacterium]
MTRRAIILASTSPWRKILLQQLGLNATAESPEFVENHADWNTVSDMVVHFAKKKAESLGTRHPTAWIIGSDQAVECEGRLFNKPGTLERGIAQLLNLEGKTHHLWTAVALHDPIRQITRHRLLCHTMRMRPLTLSQAERYIQREDPLGCAGSYKVESLGMALFESMEGTDHTAIIGLPVTALSDLFREAGEDLLDRILA